METRYYKVSVFDEDSAPDEEILKVYIGKRDADFGELTERVISFLQIIKDWNYTTR